MFKVGQHRTPQSEGDWYIPSPSHVKRPQGWNPVGSPVQRLAALNHRWSVRWLTRAESGELPLPGCSGTLRLRGSLLAPSNASVLRLIANPGAGGTYDAVRPEPYLPSLAPPFLACNL